MARDFRQLTWDAVLEDDCRQLVRLAVREDLERQYDWTTISLVPQPAQGKAAVVSRQPGVVSGLQAAAVAIDEMEAELTWEPRLEEGASIAPGDVLAVLQGSARDLLTAERLVLNLLGRLCGIATLTSQYVAAVAGTGARLYDTRKTTPGWRRLEKLAVRHGGGANHRAGLYEAVLIKDNHLAFGAEGVAGQRFSPGEAVTRARQFLREMLGDDPRAEMIVEVEVDSLDQLTAVLPAEPDLVLLDNMPPEVLRQAVALRDAAGSQAELEASGGIQLATIRAVAESGVERISVGALTHAAVTLDVGLDWQS